MSKKEKKQLIKKHNKKINKEIKAEEIYYEKILTFTIITITGTIAYIVNAFDKEISWYEIIIFIGGLIGILLLVKGTQKIRANIDILIKKLK